MSEVESKIKAIYDRVDIASNGQRSTENWSNPSINLSAPAEMDYWQWIEEAEKDALDEFTIHSHTLTNQVQVLKEALAEISNMCVGDIAMSYKLDAQYIGELIYNATGMTNPELNEALKAVE